VHGNKTWQTLNSKNIKSAAQFKIIVTSANIFTIFGTRQKSIKQWTHLKYSGKKRTN